jgi:pimeloyl-ACP methyl ester carboxylesterase
MWQYMTKPIRETLTNAKTISKKKHIMSDGAKVIVYTLIPQKENETNYPILFLPGFIGSIEQWALVLNELLHNGYRIYVHETREKTSSETIINTKRFSTVGMMQDLVEIMEQIQLQQPFIFIGVSLGSAMGLYHVIRNTNKKLLPEMLILMDAIYDSTSINRFIKVAKQSKFLFWLCTKISIHFGSIVFRQKRKNNPFSYYKYLYSLKKADIKKMRKGLICSTDIQLKEKIQKVTIPALILAVKNDETHPIEQAENIHQKLPNSVFVDLETDERLHSPETGKTINQFIIEKNKL